MSIKSVSTRDYLIIAGLWLLVGLLWGGFIGYFV